MITNYPWPNPPERERLVVRLRPGDTPTDIAIIEWAGESFVGSRPADADERRLAPTDPMIFATPGLFDAQITFESGKSRYFGFTIAPARHPAGRIARLADSDARACKH